MKVFFLGGHQYVLVELAKSWNEASADALNMGGYLAHFESLEENNKLVSFLLPHSGRFPTTDVANGAKFVWLGGNDILQEGYWVWANGLPIDGSFLNWGSGSFGSEPDNYLNQDGMALGITDWPAPSGGLGKIGQWNDLSVDEKIFSLVEFDTIKPTAGFVGSTGPDIFNWNPALGTVIADGQSGLDKLSIPGSSSNFSIQSDKVSTSEHTVYMSSMERISFGDQCVAFDIDGNAGKAYRVYKAAFARDPMAGDKAGLGYWIKSIDNGMDMVEVAARFIDSPEFRGLYGQNPSNADFLTKVYTNVLGRTPDQSGYSWWLNELNTNTAKTKAKVLADFAESQENKDSVATLIGNGIQYTEFIG